MRSLRRRRGRYAWISALALLMQLFSSSALAERHFTHTGPAVDRSLSADAMVHNHSAAETGSVAAGQDEFPAGYCSHCVDRACCTQGCVPVILELSLFLPPGDAVVNSLPVLFLSPACPAESLYRPPISL
ncbi:MAG: hypothetical protein IT488_13630 [Gammaproteobacteria bacterium]|nr:hypothetical protein [Gammaproteobacteria bacterium]